MRVANRRAVSAARPSCPGSDTGRPTITSTASYSAARAAIRATSPLPLGTVSSGEARMPPGSLRATPMRTLPASTPSRTPCLIDGSPGSGRYRAFDGGQGLGDGIRVGAAALGEVVLAAAT